MTESWAKIAGAEAGTAPSAGPAPRGRPPAGPKPVVPGPAGPGPVPESAGESPAPPSAETGDPSAETVAGLDLHLDLHLDPRPHPRRDRRPDQRPDPVPPGGPGDPPGAAARSRGRRAALEHALRAAVREGRLAPGTRLPASRVLARDLGVARNTVAQAYGQLVAEGYLRARAGAGTAVAGPGPRRPSPAPAPYPPPPPEPRHDLRPGRPDLSAFPRARWLAAARRALDAAPARAFGFPGDPRGRLELRTELAAYLGRARGVRTTPDSVVVFPGYTNALSVLSAALRGLGAVRVAVEEPTLPHLRDQVTGAGLTAVPLPVDDDGARTDLVAAGPDVAALLLTPAHQYPLGATLGPARRAAALAWARGSGGVIVEDDYDGEFRYDRHPVGALQGVDPERVVYAGTASKTLAPGVRLAWLALPRHLVGPVCDVQAAPGRSPDVVGQLTLAEFIACGDLDRHVRTSRTRHRRRRDRLVAALARDVPAVRVAGVAAGLHVLLLLPDDGPGEDEARAACARRGVAVDVLGRHWSGPEPAAGRPRALVVGYGTPAGHAYEAAAGELVAALAGLYGPACR